MNKSELVDYVAEATGATKKDSKVIIDAVFEGVKSGLVEDGKVQLVGFGTFEAKEQAARTARNPQTGEPIEVPAKTVPKFRPSSALKDAVDQ